MGSEQEIDPAFPPELCSREEAEHMTALQKLGWIFDYDFDYGIWKGREKRRRDRERSPAEEVHITALGLLGQERFRPVTTCGHCGGKGCGVCAMTGVELEGDSGGLSLEDQRAWLSRNFPRKLDLFEGAKDGK